MKEEVRVRFCPRGEMTLDRTYQFSRVPCIGEYIDYGATTYRVVDVHWFIESPAMVIAHSLDRPRAIHPFA